VARIAAPSPRLHSALILLGCGPCDEDYQPRRSPLWLRVGPISIRRDPATSISIRTRHLDAAGLKVRSPAHPRPFLPVFTSMDTRRLGRNSRCRAQAWLPVVEDLHNRMERSRKSKVGTLRDLLFSFYRENLVPTAKRGLVRITPIAVRPSAPGPRMRSVIITTRSIPIIGGRHSGCVLG